MPRLLPNTCLEEWPIFLTHSIYFWKFLFGVCGSAASQTAGACLVLRGSRHAGPASAGPRPPSMRDFTAGVRAGRSLAVFSSLRPSGHILSPAGKGMCVYEFGKILA